MTTNPETAPASPAQPIAGAGEFKTWADAKVLIVDDEPANTMLLQRLFETTDLPHTRCTNDSREALALFLEFQPDVVLLDLSMPHLDGYEVLEQLREVIPGEEYLPVLILTADATDRAKKRALSEGASDFLTKPFSNWEVVLRVRTLVQTRLLHLQLQQSNANLEAAVTQRTAELQQALSELKNTQQQVIQQERLRALGTMASGVAHDFNNSLSIILGFGEFVLRDCQNHPAMREAADQMRIIVTAAEDAAKTVNRLKEFHRTDSDQSEKSVDLNSLIEQSITLTQPRWKTQASARGVEIDTSLELDRIPQIIGHPHELREVLTNLIFNAVDAMPTGGTLTFRTHAQDGQVHLALSDTGTGMPEEVRQRCLEPFFTTKGEGGSGLGLAMVYGIIQRHGGIMEIDSQDGVGTTFRLAFPIAAGASLDSAEEPIAEADDSLRILVVEDQEVIRDMLVARLEQDLHTVVAVGSAEAGLAAATAAPFDLIITDRALTGMSGDLLAAAVREISPDTRIIVLTGFGREGDEGSIPHVDLVVGKPVSHADLRKAISTVLSGVRSSASLYSSGL